MGAQPKYSCTTEALFLNTTSTDVHIIHWHYSRNTLHFCPVARSSKLNSIDESPKGNMCCSICVLDLFLSCACVSCLYSFIFVSYNFVFVHAYLGLTKSLLHILGYFPHQLPCSGFLLWWACCTPLQLCVASHWMRTAHAIGNITISIRAGYWN